MPASAVFADCSDELFALLTPELHAVVPRLAIHRGASTDEADLVRRLSPHQAALVFMAYLSEPVLAACPNLRSITYLATGLTTHVDLAAAQRLGVRVCGVKGYGDRAVAEHTLALIFAASRRLTQMDREIRAGRWRKRRGMELSGRTLGVVGLGGNGREVVRLATAVGMNVIAWNRSGAPADLPCTASELDPLLAAADIVSLHLELNDQTSGIIDRRRLGLMKSDAILVNVARAGLIDEAALIDAARSGRLAHVALDVFWREPVPADHPLLSLPNITLTAHAAWYTREASTRLLTAGLQTLREELAAMPGEG